MHPVVRLIFPFCLVLAFPPAYGQTVPAGTHVALKPSGQLSRTAIRVPPDPGPTHVEADQLRGYADTEMIAEGRVVMQNLRERLEADWLRYNQVTDEAEARGNIVLIRDRDRIEGSSLKLKLTSRLGDAQDIRYQLYDEQGKFARGQARTLVFAGVDKYQLDDAVYTTCPAGNQDWQLKVRDLDLDFVNSVGSARQVRVEFMDVPILYAPWMDFALDENRKSGFLAPSYGASNERGLELLTPWYWNIAPNRDLTFLPRLMTKRGLQLGGEFRYLERNYAGDMNLAVLPGDRVADRNRYQMHLRHYHTFDQRWSAKVEYERVSDDAYFTDLSSLVHQTSHVNLPQMAAVSYDGGWWKGTGLVQRFQTLQDPANPIVEPYQRLPQFTLNAYRDNVQGYRNILFGFSGDYTNFDHQMGGRVQGSRLHAHPSLALPFQTSYSTVTPRIGWYFTRYALDDDSRSKPDSVAAAAPAGGYADMNRSLPVASLDASLFMERDFSFRGRDFIQTLEPRAFYVYIPYKDQDRIPVFDSSLSELSLDQMFTENQFNGVDRINNANQITLALTSRLLDQDTGVERVQLTFGQRFYFTDQRVSLTPTLSRSGADTTDLIAYVSGQITPRWRVGAGVQVNTNDGDLIKANFGGAYRDGPGRVFNVDYRYTQDVVNKTIGINQIDLSAQWPLAPRWYGVGRVNYSFKDNRLVEGLAGLEYNAGCWSLRSVVQQLATSDTTSTSAFFLQLELRGLTKLGPNPLEVLKRNISGYGKSDEFDLTQ